MKPVNVALLHYSVPPVVGGVESVLAHHARLMAEAGHQVRVIAARGAQFDARVPFVELPLADSRHAEVLAVKAELDAGQVTGRFEALVDALAGQLAQAFDGLDVVIAHNVCSLAKNLALTAALWRLSEQAGSPRLILWHHDLAWTTPRYRAELHDGYPWDLLRRDWPAAAQVVVSALRQHELAELIGVPLERVQVVPNGLDAPAFLKLETQTRALVRQLNLLAAQPLLLLPVRLTPRKNVELALHTLAALRAQPGDPAMADPRLVVTGPLGPHNPANVKYFARLRELRAQLGLEHAAHFLAELSDAYLPDEVIADFFRLADALLLPSREEGFGIPVIEAGLSRLPVFCTDIPPLRELGGEEAVYFSPEADPARVARLIAERLANDPAYRLAARVRRSYTWERIYAENIAPLLHGRTGEAPAAG